MHCICNTWIKYISKKSFDWNFLLHTTLITFITSLKKFNMLSKKCWSSSDISYICKFVTKQFLRDHATYYRNKLCQYGNILRSSGKLHVYLVLMILVFGYYETIILKTRNLWSEYKCILPKNISSSRDNGSPEYYICLKIYFSVICIYIPTIGCVFLG